MLATQVRLLRRVVVNVPFPVWLSTDIFPTDSKYSKPSMEVSSPFHFEKSTHILGYTGLKPYKYPRILPKSFEKCLQVVKDKCEGRLTYSEDMDNLALASATLSEMETTLESVKKYYHSTLPSNPGASISIIRACINMGRPDVALGVLKNPTEFGVFASSYPLALLMDAFLKTEQFELALDVYELTQYMFSPIMELTIAVSAFTHICEGSSALFLEARELMLKLQTYEWEYSADALRIALGLLMRQNRFVLANQLIREFEQFDTFTMDEEIGELVRDINSKH